MYFKPSFMSSYYPLTAILWIMPGNEFSGTETLQGNVYFMSSRTLKLGSCSHLDLPLLPWCSWKEPTHVPQLCSPFHCPPVHCPGQGSRCRYSVGWGWARVLFAALRKCSVNIWNLFLQYISLSTWGFFLYWAHSSSCPPLALCIDNSTGMFLEWFCERQSNLFSLLRLGDCRTQAAFWNFSSTTFKVRFMIFTWGFPSPFFLQGVCWSFVPALQVRSSALKKHFFDKEKEAKTFSHP